MTSPKPPDSTSLLLGARASNAGDAYHELWALQAAMQLLVPNTELRAVTVEGIPSPAGSEYAYEGVDCGLLYGGTSLQSASRVELVQLKYSTANPDKAWTIARLVASSSKTKNNSVIRTLAETYRQATLYTAKTVDVTIHLVSNQPIDQDVIDATAKITSGERKDVDCSRLIKASGLHEAQVAAFFSVLDFSKMKSSSRLQLSSFLAALVADTIDGPSDAYLMQLQQQVRGLMLPGRERECITQGVLLSWFSVVSLESLFPAPAKLKPVTAPIARHPAVELLAALEEKGALFCLHGPGGCGKTTTLMQLLALLPPGSISVLFDCYGAGQYTFSHDRRHLPENAFLQITNNLAQALETPLLIAKSSTNPATIRTFMDRVRRAAKSLSAARPEAVLAILIDAADNSVAVAEAPETVSACFVWELTGADLNSLPSNVKIVISTRTARKPKLRLPKGVPEVECPPFTLEETAAFVRSRLPSVPDTWIEEFHALSNGIPRVQTYSFAKGGSSSNSVLNSLRPKGKKLDTILRELFEEAANKAGGGNFYNRCLTSMSILPAPIPLKHLAQLTGATVEAIADFVNDVAPTLRIENGCAAIADEDVEDFIRDEASEQKPATLAEICSYFLSIYRTDTYAAVYYCDFLAQAGRAAEIIPILEKDLLPAGVADPIESREVQLRRLRLALGACRDHEKAVDALKVILLSAEAAKDEAALRELLTKETDLSVRFANASLMRTVLSDRDSYPTQGAILAQDAARAAEMGDALSARERLGAYEYWMQRRKEAINADRNETQTGWQIEREDVVAICEAVALLDGPRACCEHVIRWRPKPFRLQIAISLIPRLIARGYRDIVVAAYAENLVPAPWSLLLTVPLALSGYDISTDRLANELKALNRRQIPQPKIHLASEDRSWELSFLELLVTGCEIATARGVENEPLQRVLVFILDRSSSRSARIASSDASRIDLLLRIWLIDKHLRGEKANTQSFIEWAEPPAPPMPKVGRKKTKAVPPKSRDDSDFTRAIQTIFPVYESRLQILMQKRAKNLDPKEATIAGLGNDAFYLDREYYSSHYRQCIGRSIARLIHISEISAVKLYERTIQIVEGRERNAFAHRLLPAWKAFLLESSTHSLVLADISLRAEDLRKIRAGSRSKADALTAFSRIALNFSNPDAKALFERVIETAQEIDREAITQIRFVSELLARPGLFEGTAKAVAMQFAAFATDVALRLEGEDGYPWEELTNALTKLAPEAALAAVAQWQDEGIADPDDTLTALMMVIASQSPDRLFIATAFTSLLTQIPVDLFGVLADLAAAATKPDAVLIFETLAFYCLRQLNGERRVLAGQALLAKTPKSLLDGQNIKYLQEAISFYSWHKETFREALSPARSFEVDFPEESDFSTESGIAAAIDDARKRERERYTPLREILVSARRKIVAPAARVPFLNATATLGDSLDASDRANEILAALCEWKDSPAVASWKQTVLPNIIAQHIWSLSRWLDEGSNALVKLLDASCADDRSRIDVVLRGLANGPKGFSSNSLFGLAGIVARALAFQDARDLAEWYVARLHYNVPTDIQLRFRAADLPETFDDAVGRFLNAQMSDIDVRRRWRAAHCVRYLVRFLGAPPLTALLSAYERQTETSFRIAEAAFYWMAARLWAIIATARIAVENPIAAASCKTKLLEILADDAFPHYLVRDYTKAALQSLASAGAISLSTDEMKTLHEVNSPSKKPKKSRKRAYRELGGFNREETRFKFDSMDTIPYWYSPLFRHFADMTPERFFGSLESWLLDEWKVDPEANRWVKEARRARFEKGQMMSSHRQGSMPVFERYGTYLEWHVMFCCLPEWLKMESLVIPEWASDGLDGWTDRWRPTESPTWLADRRSFSPLEPAFKPKGGNDRHWLRRIPRDEFLAFLYGAGDRATIVIDGSITIAHPSREIAVTISSALVDSTTAKALMQTMQAADRYKFHLPSADREDHDERFDNSPFLLRPWVAYLDRETKFDDDDPVRNEVGGIALGPAKWLTEKYHLQSSGFPVSKWIGPAGQDGLEYLAWSDFVRKQDDRYSRRDAGTTGHQLKIGMDLLNNIIRTERLSVIVKIEVEHRLEKEYGRSSSWNEEDKRSAAQKILVLSEDGAIYGTEGNLGTWRRNRKSAGAGGRPRPSSPLDVGSFGGKNGGGEKSQRHSKRRAG